MLRLRCTSRELVNMASLSGQVERQPVCRKEDCSPFDIGTVYKGIASFSDAEKFRFIESVWKPDLLFEFPASKETSGKQRKFRQEWLVKYPWLVYSKYLDGAFCLPCVCFGMECGRNGAKLDKLFRSPLTFWTTACSRMESHASGKSEIHKFSVMAMQNFLSEMRRQTTPIDQQLNRLIQAQIDENREKMKSIVKTVIFCGQNNIPLRGKRDDNPDDRNLQGNFQALLEFRIDSGDLKLKEHLENAPRNATYRSKTIQNEIIETVGNYISSKIIAEVKQSRMFSVMADEAADVSNKENLSLVLRYVDSSKNIREEFVGFYLCGEETTGNAIKELIINTVRDLGLTMDNCRGQSYDGAGNMAGRYVGASTLIQNQFPKAIYVHCMNHRLNLCVADTCSLSMVQNMMGTVRKLSEFFSNSPKRQHHLVDKIKELLPNSNHRILIDVCRTRWIARIDGLDRIVELLVPVLSTLEDVQLNKDKNGVVRAGTWNPKSRDDARSLLNAVTFGFIVTLVIVKYILNLTRPATVKLQSEEMDILKAEQEITTLQNALKDMQTNIEGHHHRLFDEAVQLSQKVGLEPSRPRIVQRQIFRSNCPASNPEAYYRINLTQVFLDHCLQQLQSRFPQGAYVYFKGFSVIPSVLLKTPSTWKAQIQEFCHHYARDLPNVVGLPAELELWQRIWTEKKEKAEDIPEKIANTLKSVDPVSFPNIFTILKILATIPVTSCSCERSISCLRYLKNYLRATMGEERLNGLALMHAHRDIPLDLDEIINLFASLHPRRMRMANILCSDSRDD
ncbi:52 kDa repressor of the inhibitor of the protein kinase-like [Montipora foliosa]|uniref:52 kDa repressor of the inhibitor of the protein kinase-like n=1 Tax=Montipora foliosa TaxID=591990 RepID=UPI0035F114CC